MIPAPFAHQKAATEFWLTHPRMCNFSDPGTGKTRATLDAIAARNTGKRALVVAPLSILEASWGADIKKFTPQLTYSVADAKNRKKAFAADTDIVLINHDGVKALADEPGLLKDFDTLVVDESTAYKHRTSTRSKAMAELACYFTYRVVLTGTPNSNTVTDLWHQLYLVDDGERLGKNFFGFRAHVCEPRILAVGGKQITKWVDKEKATALCTAMTADITFRVKFEDVIEIPPNHVRTIYTELPQKIMQQYREFQRESVLMLESGAISAMNAGVRLRKLLQLLTGAVYDEQGQAHVIHTERYKLVLDLVEETDHCVVAFNWRHERVALTEEATKRKLAFAVIDGETPAQERAKIVDDFQSGKLQVVFAHPQSAGHGLTLTRGNRTIWASPTYNAEHYQQFCHRIYRAGQTRKTETIRIAATNTVELDVYDKLGVKLDAMDELLSYAALTTNFKKEN
nr:MAG TPA: Chromatin remodeling complex ATPase [Caudoviricetes sp.]